jgi:hypothetical protein
MVAETIRTHGFRAVYPEAVDPLCRAIEERMRDAKLSP